MEYLESQSHGECDFLLHINGESFPFEVTRATSERRQRLYAQILGSDGEKQFLNRQCAKYDWLVFPSHSADIRKLRKDVDAALAAIEAEGRTSFDINADGGASAAVLRIWDDLRVEHGVQMQWDPPGRIAIATPADGGTLSSDSILGAVEHELHKPDNRRKLGASRARERHLAVYLDDLGYLPQASMRHGLIPDAPAMPPETTHLWVITNVGREPEYLVWRFDSATGWKDCGRFQPATHRPGDA
jgi:hypothetical protein